MGVEGRPYKPTFPGDSRELRHEYHEGPKAGENFEEMARAFFSSQGRKDEETAESQAYTSQIVRKTRLRFLPCRESCGADCCD